MFWQISPPTVPIPTEQLRDFKSGLDVAWQNATSTVAPELLALGNDLWEGMAVIVVVWTGLRIAFSGDIQPWDFVQLVIGLWIPWVLLQFYNQPIPGMAMSFPVMISSGGTWVQTFFIGDIAYDMQTAMTTSWIRSGYRFKQPTKRVACGIWFSRADMRRCR